MGKPVGKLGSWRSEIWWNIYIYNSFPPCCGHHLRILSWRNRRHVMMSTTGLTGHPFISSIVFILQHLEMWHGAACSNQSPNHEMIQWQLNIDFINLIQLSLSKCVRTTSHRGGWKSVVISVCTPWATICGHVSAAMSRYHEMVSLWISDFSTCKIRKLWDIKAFANEN